MKLKFDIKKYLALGVVVAGSSLMVSCDGEDGAAGADGARGATGLTGAAGADGARGATGLTGAAGADGARGATGLTGAQGATGNDGSQGPIGLTGAQGPKGDKGDKGEPGVAGITSISDIYVNDSVTSTFTSFGLVFDADPLVTTVASPASLTTTGPGTSIASGDTLITLESGTDYNVSGVSAASGVVTIANLRSVVAANADFENLILTETNTSLKTSTGSFTVDLVTQAAPGIPVPVPTLAPVIGTAPNATTLPSGHNALVSVSGNPLVTVTTAGNTITLPIGYAVFIDGGAETYITNTAAPFSSTLNPVTDTALDITEALPTLPAGGVVRIVSGTLFSVRAPLTGTYSIVTQ